MSPRVSVVMPVRDGERFLAEAVGSILAQSLTALELVVVDDGSRDATPKILAALAADDARVVVVTQPPGGLAAALNAGCAAARAPLLARLDADDRAYPGRLATQAAVLDARPRVGLVGGGYHVVDADGRVLRTIRPPAGDDALRRALARHNCFAHPTVMFRRSAFEELGGYRTAFPPAEDYDLWLRVAERWELAAVPEPVIAYRRHGGQASVADLRQQTLGFLAAQAAAERRRAGSDDRIDDTPFDEAALDALGVTPARRRRALAAHYARQAAAMAGAGDERAARTLLAQAAGLPDAPRPRELRALVALERAAAAARAGRRGRALALGLRALAVDPRPAAGRVRERLSHRRA